MTETAASSGRIIPPVTSPRKDYRRLVMGILISAALLIWVLWKINFGAAFESIRNVSISWLALALSIKLFTIRVKSVRWSVLLKEALGVWPEEATRAVFIGYFGNAVFPFKMGELIRIQVIRKHHASSFSNVFATIVLERSMDALTLLSFLLLATLVFPLPDWMKQGAVLTTGLFFCLSTLLLLVSLRSPRILDRAAASSTDGFGVRFCKRCLRFFLSGLAVVRSPSTLLAAIGITICAWSLETLGTYCAFLAFHLHLSFFVSALLTVIVSLGVAAPSAPSGLGTSQFLYVLCLGWFAVSKEVALSLSVCNMLLMLLALAGFGLYFLWREGMDLSLFWNSRVPAEEMK